MSTSGSKQKVLIIDDHPLLCDALCRVVSMFSANYETFTALSAKAAKEVVLEQGLDWAFILCDLNLPDQSGIDLVKELTGIFPQPVPVIIMTGQTDDMAVRAAKASGAAGFVLKTADPTSLMAAFQAIVDGKTFFPPLAGQLIPAPTDLKSRQHKVILDLVLQGLPDKAIAEEVHLSPGRVRNILGELFDIYQLTTRSRSSLIQTLVQLGYKAPKTS